jgi:oligopeptide transport system permease protein
VLRFLAGRAVQMAVTLWLAMTLLFVAVSVLPGDPVRALFGFRQPPPDVYDAIVRQYRLDRPLWEQYLLFLADLLRGDLGESYPRNPFGRAESTVQVVDVIRASLPVSARLVLAALVVQLLVGVVAGLLSARRGRRSGPVLYGTAVVLVAVPVVVLAYLLRSFVAYRTGLFPTSGTFEGARSYVLPVLALAALSTGYVALLTRAEVRSVLASRFVHLARAKGLSDERVLTRHALRPALVPVVAYVAASIGPSLVALVVVEGVFGLPGLGGAVLDAVRSRDRSLVVGLVAFVMAVVVVATAVADVLTAWLDPRQRDRLTS